MITPEQHPLLDSLKQRLGNLEAALLAGDPEMKNHLREIHKSCIAHEELVHLLSDEDIATMMGAQQILTNTVLAQAVAKKTATKKTAGLTMGDL